MMSSRDCVWKARYGTKPNSCSRIRAISWAHPLSESRCPQLMKTFPAIFSNFWRSNAERAINRWPSDRPLVTPCVTPSDFEYFKIGCKLLIGPAGLEPATPCLEGRCSIQLSYGPKPALVHQAGKFSTQSHAAFLSSKLFSY